MIATITTVVGIGLILAGVAFALIGSIGVLRLPDFYTRIHAASKLDTMSLGLCMTGLAVLQGPDLNAVKLVLIFAFASIANPAAANALGRSAVRAGLEPWSVERQKKGKRK